MLREPNSLPNEKSQFNKSLDSLPPSNTTNLQSSLVVPLEPTYSPNIQLKTIDPAHPKVFSPITLGYAYLKNLCRIWVMSSIRPIDRAIVFEDKEYSTVKMIFSKLTSPGTVQFDTKMASWAVLRIIDFELKASRWSNEWHARDFWVQSNNRNIGEIESVPYRDRPGHVTPNQTHGMGEEGAGGEWSSSTEADISKRDISFQNDTEITSFSSSFTSTNADHDIRIYFVRLDAIIVPPSALIQVIQLYANNLVDLSPSVAITTRFGFDIPIHQTFQIPPTSRGKQRFLSGTLTLPRPVAGGPVPKPREVMACLLEALSAGERSLQVAGHVTGFRATCEWRRRRGAFAVFEVTAMDPE